jgi:hypothetical protein
LACGSNHRVARAARQVARERRELAIAREHGFLLLPVRGRQEIETIRARAPRCADGLPLAIVLGRLAVLERDLGAVDARRA